MMVGASCVGKTALSRRFVQNIFPEYYEPTIEDSYRKQVMTIDREACLIDILDTAGLYNEYCSLLESNLRRGDGFLCVYSVEDMRSYEMVDYYISKITLTKPKAPIVLCK